MNIRRSLLVLIILSFSKLYGEDRNEVVIKVGCETFSRPIISNNKIYFGTTKGSLISANALTGDIIWKNDGYNRIDGNILLHKNNLIFNPADGIARSVNIEDGKTIWEKQIAGSGYKHISTLNEQLIIPGSRSINWMSPENGSISKTIPLNGECSYYIIQDNKIYVYTIANVTKNNYKGEGKVSCINVDSGNCIWTLEGIGANHGNMDMHENVIFTGCRDGYIYAINANDGSVKWKLNCDDIIPGHKSAIWTDRYIKAINNSVFCIVNQQNIGEHAALIRLDANTGKLIWKASSSESICCNFIELNKSIISINQAREILIVDQLSGSTQVNSRLTKDDERAEFSDMQIDGNGIWINGADNFIRYLLIDKILNP